MRILQNFLCFFLFISVQCSPQNVEVVEDFSTKPSKEFIKEWENMMSDFLSEDIKTFMIHSYETDVILIHEVAKEDNGKSFKGAYFIHNEKNIKAEVKIFNAKGKTMLKSNGNEGIFNFNCTSPGIYQIVIMNKERKNFKITLATHFFNEKVPVNQEVNTMEQKLEGSLKKFKSLMTENKFTEQQRKSQTSFIESAYNRIFLLNIIETFIIVAVTGAQIYYIEKLLNNNKITV